MGIPDLHQGHVGSHDTASCSWAQQPYRVVGSLDPSRFSPPFRVVRRHDDRRGSFPGMRDGIGACRGRAVGALGRAIATNCGCVPIQRNAVCRSAAPRCARPAPHATSMRSEADGLTECLRGSRGSWCGSELAPLQGRSLRHADENGVVEQVVHRGLNEVRDEGRIYTLLDSARRTAPTMRTSVGAAFPILDDDAKPGNRFITSCKNLRRRSSGSLSGSIDA